MPPRTQPCGTPAAAVYHRRHGEPVDDACAKALARYRRFTTQRERALAPIALCAGCGRTRLIRVKRHQWCGSCHTRWLGAGKPAGGPPPLLAPEELRAVRARSATIARAAQQLDRAIERGGWEWAA